VGPKSSLGWVRRFDNEMLKVEKWFIVLKTVNYFLKIKEEFSVEGKIFILCRTKHSKIQKTFFVNHFTAKQIEQ
jgi:hypothetical protein